MKVLYLWVRTTFKSVNKLYGTDVGCAKPLVSPHQSGYNLPFILLFCSPRMITYNILHFLNSLSDFTILYVLASLVIAVLTWIESTLIAKNNGKLPSSAFFAVISILTSSWFIISALALYFLDFDGVMISVPVAYGVYSVMGWFKGVRLMGDDLPDDPKDIVLPTKYLTYTQSFALVFAGLCMAMLAHPYMDLSFL